MGLKRYPGALPFSKQQENIFYGREKDINQLKTLIRVENQVLLYSRSGLGKTSLLEAGVIPKLPDNYIPLTVRFFAYDKEQEKQLTPVERIIQILKNKIHGKDKDQITILDKIIGEDKTHKTLWYHFKNLHLQEESTDTNDEKSIYLLVFDQFEELFTYPTEQVNEFKDQYYELTRLPIPDNFIRLISKRRKSAAETIDRSFIASLHQKMEIKTVFAIRSDRLALLNRLSDKIIDIQKVHKVLKPLDSQQARDAIEKPARNKGEGFDTRPFKYDEKAIDKIIRDLTLSEDKHLETTQLQIVCQRIEEIAAKKYEKEKNGKEVVIYEEDVPDLSNIFDKFYDDSIIKLEKDEQDKAKRFIEGQLIKNEVRISLDIEVCKGAVSEKTLETLVNAHLLRAERNTMERISYELSHDTLIQSVLDSRKKHEASKARIEAEEKRKEEIKQAEEKSLEELKKLREEQERKEEINRLKAEQEKKEEINRLKAEQQKQDEIRKLKEEQERKDQKAKEEREKIERRKQRTIIVIVSIAAIVAVGLAIYAGIQYKVAEKATDEALIHKANADTALMIADSSLRELIEEQYKFNFSEGEKYLSKPDYPKAKELFINALAIKYHPDSIDQKDPSRIKRDYCEQQIFNQPKFDSLIYKAKGFEKDRKYVEAMTFYNKAYRTKYDTNQIIRARDRLYEDAEEAYTEDIRDYREWKDTTMFNYTVKWYESLNDLYKKK